MPGGIAGFTIVDGSKVESRDLGNNFLLAETDLGHSKAQGVSSLLKELNDSVAGGFVETDPAQLIDDQPDFFKGFSLIIATQVMIMHRAGFKHAVSDFMTPPPPLRMTEDLKQLPCSCARPPCSSWTAFAGQKESSW